MNSIEADDDPRSVGRYRVPDRGENVVFLAGNAPPSRPTSASACTENSYVPVVRSGVTPLHPRQVNASPRRLRKSTRSTLLYHLIRSLMPRSASVIPVRRVWNQAHTCDPDGSYRSTSRRTSASSASSLGIRDRIAVTFLGPYWMIHTSNGFAGNLSVSVRPRNHGCKVSDVPQR